MEQLQTCIIDIFHNRVAVDLFRKTWGEEMPLQVFFLYNYLWMQEKKQSCIKSCEQ